ncbi:hypothetical protein RHSP_39398 [Rhizobium freirei PRF 81]|uniref:Uncharacterized protein n=1 Tax=Rhizobium freirei PRF 81 TaxID=363754 RepID=N6V4V2_9HYPH|nr:hypothetical protein [Rhizobium freirei]ENN88146.1 hypothetical protein RHSP_39398 [Rhizobium freirei PRF 81]
MHSDNSPTLSQTDVLICLDNQQVATRIGSVLSERGLTVATIPATGIQAWFEPNGCQVVVTHTAMIGQIRTRLKLPIVNLEAFIFERPDHAAEGAPRQFDGDAFIKRIFMVMGDAHKRAARGPLPR